MADEKLFLWYTENQTGNHINQKGLWEVIPAPFAVNLNADDTTYVESYVSVICAPAKITDQGCCGAPDLVIEVVYPGSRKMDYEIKIVLYVNYPSYKGNWLAKAHG